MASQHGYIREFHPESDSIKSYLKRVQLYFEANDVAADKQVAVLLSSIGAPTYSLISDLAAPGPPIDKTLREIEEILRKHYEPKRAVIAERFLFHKKEQAAGETIAEFDASLRKLATSCQFGATLGEALRDRFVCGLRHESIQRRLLSEQELTYNKALDIAQAMEAADSNTNAFKATEPLIHKFSRQASKPKLAKLCYRCGRRSHSLTNRV